MQFNSNLLQSVLGHTKGAKATSGEGSNALVSPEQGGVSEVSNEFLSLLNETKAIAESGVTSEEFIETLNTEELGLTGGEKKALAKSFIEAVDAKAQTETISGPKTEIIKNVEPGSTEELLSKLQGNTKANVTKLTTGHELQKDTPGVANLSSKVSTEEVSKTVNNIVSKTNLIKLKQRDLCWIREGFVEEIYTK